MNLGKETDILFVDRYKDLELMKWVKRYGWRNAAADRQEITASVDRYLKSPEKLNF